MIRHSIFFFMVSIITSMFSIVNKAYDTEISPINIIGTIIFLISLCLYSYIQGRMKNSSYTKFIIGCGILVLITAIMAFITKKYMFNIFLFLIVIPMYPIAHTLEAIMSENLAMFLVILIEIAVILISYKLGKIKRISQKII